jgi:Putative MetA-pathway of phenol degradation
MAGAWARERLQAWLRTSVRALLMAACVAAGGAAPAAAQQRPIVTEDPETIGAGRILLEAGIEYGGGVEFPIYGLKGGLWRLPALGVSIGISSIAELQIDSGYSRMRVTSRRPAPLAPILDFQGDHTSSIEDVVLATKIRVLSEGTNRPSFGLRIATKLPNARNQSGLGTDMTDVSLAVLVGKTIRSIRVVGNLGVAIIGDPTQTAVQYDPTIFGVSLARALAPGFDVVTEIEGRWQAYKDTPQPAAENRAALRGGLRYTRGAVRVDAGLRTGFGDVEPEIGFTTGVTWVVDAFTVP